MRSANSNELKTAALLAGQDLGIIFHVLPDLRVTVQMLKAYDQATAHKNVSEQIQAIRRYYKGPFWIDYEYLDQYGRPSIRKYIHSRNYPQLCEQLMLRPTKATRAAPTK